MSEKKAIKEEVLALSTKISATLKTDEKAGLIEGTIDPYLQNLPEGLSEELLKAKADYDTTYIAAGSHAVGEAGLKLLQENKELDKVTGTLPMGVKDSLNTTIYRQKEFVNPKSETGEKLVKKGSMMVSFDTRGTNNSGQLALVKQSLLEAAANTL